MPETKPISTALVFYLANLERKAKEPEVAMAKIGEYPGDYVRELVVALEELERNLAAVRNTPRKLSNEQAARIVALSKRAVTALDKADVKSYRSNLHAALEQTLHRDPSLMRQESLGGRIVSLLDLVEGLPSTCRWTHPIPEPVPVRTPNIMSL